MDRVVFFLRVLLRLRLGLGLEYQVDEYIFD